MNQITRDAMNFDEKDDDDDGGMYFLNFIYQRLLFTDGY